MNNSKRNILVLGSVPPPIGGATVYFQTLLRTQVASKFNIIFLDLKFADSIADYGQFSLQKILRLIGYMIRLCGILLTKNIDLVYSAIQFKKAPFYKDILLAAVCRLFSKRVVGCIVGIGLEDLYNKSGKFIKFSIRRGLGLYYAFTTPSLAMYERYFPSELMPTKKARVVPFGIFTDAGTPIDRILTTSDPIQVIYYSHFIKSKGVDDLVSAIPTVIKKYPNVNFLFVGSWDSESHKEFLMSYVQSLGINDYVKFMGLVTGDVRRQCLASSDIFVLPTYFEFEGLPLSILEAMSYGCAIITTDHAAISSVVKNGINGLLCRPKDPQDLAFKIATLLKDKQALHQIKLNNINKFHEFYTAERFGERLVGELNLLCKADNCQP